MEEASRHSITVAYNMERPSTSKPRGICKYYETPRGCFAGKNCKFLHGQDEKLTPYDQNKTCRYYRAGASLPRYAFGYV